MTRHPYWSDEYWLLLMQIYLKKPEGMKALYSKAVVDLALELHIPPLFLHQQMFRLRQLDTPRMERLWQKYSHSPKKLARAVSLLRQMKGFGQASEFYSGVDIVESWEKDFLPIDGCDGLTPVMVILVLDLYFRLTPATMVAETPEVKELARKLHIDTSVIIDIMTEFQCCDPYLRRTADGETSLTAVCKDVWQRYGDTPETLEGEAAKLREYFVR